LDAATTLDIILVFQILDSSQMRNVLIVLQQKPSFRSTPQQENIEQK